MLVHILPYISVIILYIGMYFLIKKQQSGWIYRIIAHLLFAVYCFWVVPSIHIGILYIVDAVFDIIGFYKWKDKKQLL